MVRHEDTKACKHCSFMSEEDTCPLCGNQTSKDWQGYVIIVECTTRSEIAKRMRHVNGKLALKVQEAAVPPKRMVPCLKA